MILTRRTLMATAGALPVATLFARGALAALPPVYMERGIAIDGSDPVAYFTERRPVPGSRDITLDWNGATWRFASAENRDAFAGDPAAWAPQYGGYCAWAVSEGYTASTVPEAWKIVDGRLFLNYSRRFQRKWERDETARIQAGDANWPKVLQG